MHKPIIIPILFSLLVTVGIVSGCEELPEVDTTDRETFIASIAQTWTVSDESTITIEDQDITHLLIGFELTINEDLTYTSNSDELTLEEFPWPTAGSFELNDELTQFTRDDGLQITLAISADEDELELNFVADENTASRALGAKGGWKCKFKSK